MNESRAVGYIRAAKEILKPVAALSTLFVIALAFGGTPRPTNCIQGPGEWAAGYYCNFGMFGPWFLDSLFSQVILVVGTVIGVVMLLYRRRARQGVTA